MSREMVRNQEHIDSQTFILGSPRCAGRGGGWSATLSPLSIRGTARGAARWLTVSGQSVTGGRCRLRRSISLLGARFSIDGEFQRLGGRSSRAGCGKPHE